MQFGRRSRNLIKEVIFVYETSLSCGTSACVPSHVGLTKLFYTVRAIGDLVKKRHVKVAVPMESVDP